MACECGNKKFFAHQVMRASIVCDDVGNFEENGGENLEESIYDSGSPYGPFACTECGKEYDELPEVKKEQPPE